jgi:hypothetical protein
MNKKMKKIILDMRKSTSIKILSILVFAVIVSACDKYLDLDPQQAISSEHAITHEGMLSALNGAYTRIGGPQMFAGTDIFFPISWGMTAMPTGLGPL